MLLLEYLSALKNLRRILVYSAAANSPFGKKVTYISQAVKCKALRVKVKVARNLKAIPDENEKAVNFITFLSLKF